MNDRLMRLYDKAFPAEEFPVFPPPFELEQFAMLLVDDVLAEVSSQSFWHGLDPITTKIIIERIRKHFGV